MSHTPGPWTVKTPPADPNAFDVYAGETPITRGYWAHNGKADARLIAAAPTMLGALYSAHGTMARQLDRDGMGPEWWGDDEHETFRELTDAIAKAEGKP